MDARQLPSELPPVAVYGPGRLGQALARHWVASGVPFVGFSGRRPEAVQAGLGFAGRGRALGPDELHGAGILALCVSDTALPAVAAQLAPQLGPKTLVLHCAGSAGLEVLQACADAGLRRGALHPLSPVPDPETGYHNLPGKPAVLEAEPGDAEVAGWMRALAAAAGLEVHFVQGADRVRYHAACVLAANGLTALYDQVRELLEAALPGVEARDLPAPLMQAAVATAARLGPAAALSGPVPRGDAGVLGAQLRALRTAHPQIAPVYQGLMQRAVQLAGEAGRLDPAGQARLLEVLAAAGEHG